MKFIATIALLLTASNAVKLQSEVEPSYVMLQTTQQVEQ